MNQKKKLGTTCITTTDDQLEQMAVLQKMFELSRSALIRKLVSDAALIYGVPLKDDDNEEVEVDVSEFADD